MAKNMTIEQAIKSYKSGPPPVKGGDGAAEWVTNPQYNETRRFLGKSFAGTEIMAGEPINDWACNHIKGNSYTEEQHRQAITFGIGLACYGSFKRNPLVVSRREAEDGEISSAAIVLNYNAKRESSVSHKFTETWRQGVAFCKLMMKESLPELFERPEHKEELKHYEKKWKKVISTMEKWHKKHGPKEDHWYISMVGVGPEHKGKGYGRELMEKIHNLADEAGVPCCYLECGASNKAFYERMGYAVSAQLTIEDPVDSNRDPCVIFVMVRLHPDQQPARLPEAYAVSSTLAEEEQSVSVRSEVVRAILA